MFRSIVLLFITGFWLVMTSRLVQKEFFEISTFETSSQWIPITTTAIREDYKAILLGHERIGFDYNSMQRHDDKGEGIFELGHNSYMYFALLGKPSEMFIKGKAWLNQDLSLKSFHLIVRTKDYSTEMDGKVSPNQIDVLIKEKDHEPSRKTIPLEGPVLYSESLEHLWTPENLRIGKESRFKVFHPLLLSVEDIRFRVERKEKITQNSETRDAFVIMTSTPLYETKTWVNQEGVVLRKETTNGLILEREPAWETFDALRAQMASPPDLPNFYSIPSNIILENPEELSYLKLEVDLAGKINPFEIKKQTLTGLDQVTFADLDITPALDKLKATDFIQSDHPEIKSKAKEIVGDETAIISAGKKIMEWVHTSMTPNPTASIPSALQVLGTRKGDCNEYTALFTALARASGIPTQMIAGLVYQQGRFFYHAWAAIYAGQWIYVDPTFRQLPVDVTHIPLVLGDLREQVELANKIGRIKVTVSSQSSPKG